MNDVELAPLRPLEDFLLSSARFQVPNLKDAERVANRIINNLLYYQTNYFITALVVFLVVGILHPSQMVFGFAAVMTAFVGFVYITNHRSELRRFKRDRPGMSACAILVVGYLLVYLLGSVVVFLFGIALPLLVILMHAALRMRNLKSKISNKIEYVGLKRTPMGLLLESLGMEAEAGS